MTHAALSHVPLLLFATVHNVGDSLVEFRWAELALTCRLQDYTVSPASPDPVSPVSLKPKRAALSQEALAAKELQRERRRRERAYRRMQVRRWCSHEPVSAIVSFRPCDVDAHC